MEYMFIVFLLFIFLIEVLNARPESGNSVKKNFQQPAKLPDEPLDEKLVDLKKLFSCMSENFHLRMQMCNNQTITEAYIEEIRKLPSEAEKEAYAWPTLMKLCECHMMKYDVIDATTGQFELTKYISKTIEESTLSSEKKSIVSADFKSCIVADLSDATLPLYIDSIGKKPDAKNFGNRVSVVQTTICGFISLVKNGCPHPSVESSTVAQVIKEYTKTKDKGKSSMLN